MDSALRSNEVPNDYESYDESSDNSSYERMMHPNEENAMEKTKTRRYYTGCLKYLHRFDELIMKPVFIYRYERNMQRKSKDFFNLFMKQGT